MRIWEKLKISADSSFVTLMIVLSSAAAVIIAVFTLFEMKAQREMASKPILVIEEGFAELNPVYFECDSLDIVRDFKCDFEDEGHFVRLINIGNGPALDIEVEWQIDLENYKTFFYDSLKSDTSLINYNTFSSEELSLNFKCNNYKRVSGESWSNKNLFSH